MTHKERLDALDARLVEDGDKLSAADTYLRNRVDGNTTEMLVNAARVRSDLAKIGVGLDDVRSDCAEFRQAIESLNERVDDVESKGATEADLTELEDKMSEDMISHYDELKGWIDELRDVIDEDRPHKPAPSTKTKLEIDVDTALGNLRDASRIAVFLGDSFGDSGTTHFSHLTQAIAGARKALGHEPKPTQRRTLKELTDDEVHLINRRRKDAGETV